MSQDVPEDFAAEAAEAVDADASNALDGPDATAEVSEAEPWVEAEPSAPQPFFAEPIRSETEMQSLQNPEPLIEQPPAFAPAPPPLQLENPVQIPVAEPAPLAVPARSTSNTDVLGLPLQLLNQLLARLGSAPLSNLTDLMPALRLLALLLLAGFVLKLTGATLDALNEIPMLGRLLELVGLISALNFLARNALRSQKRAELLTRIQKLKRQFLG